MTGDGAVSVVICTRNRGSAPLSTIASVRAMKPAAVEVIVVDQSDDHSTASALARLVREGTIRYVRSSAVGLALARNRGLTCSRSAIVAFTDDDCEVEPDFAKEVAAVFAAEASIGLVFGSVLPAPYDTRLGIIPSYQPTGEFTARTLLDRRYLGGMGACMALHRQRLGDLALFDPCLGAGAPLHSGEETDLALRVLARGIWVHVTPRAQVLHHGFRSLEASPGLIVNYMFGTGAVFAKHLRLGLPQIPQLLLQMAEAFLLGPPVVHYSHECKRRLRLSAFARGFCAGMWRSLDHVTGQFKP